MALTCRCKGGNPFVETAGLHGLMLICAQPQAVLKEDQPVGPGIQQQLHRFISEFLDVAGFHQPVVSWLSMVRPIQFKREVFAADRRLRHRTTFGLQPDDLVTIVDKHVEVLQEVLAEYTSYVADDGCQMTGADQI
jgi:hypothetical protein